MISAARWGGGKKPRSADPPTTVHYLAFMVKKEKKIWLISPLPIKQSPINFCFWGGREEEEKKKKTADKFAKKKKSFANLTKI